MTLFQIENLTERQLQKEKLVPFLVLERYKVNQVYKLQTKTGRWLTSTTLVGLPDVMAVGRGHTLWIEVKGNTTPIESRQIELLEFFAATCPTNRCWVVRPKDCWDDICDWIHNPADAPSTYGWTKDALQKALGNQRQRTKVR